MINPTDIFPLLGYRLNDSNSVHLDLSIHNPDKDLKLVVDSSTLSLFINKKLQNTNLVGYGGYSENRTIYNRFPLFNQYDDARNIHLGVDLWVNDDTPIYLPFNGVIYGQDIHHDEGGYGGVIIVKHTQGGNDLYTLYGHLSHDSIGMYDEGEPVSQGEVIGHVGIQSENGGWPPHLHFQVIQDIGDYKRDYPGVCNEEKAEQYLSNCPNPKDFYLDFDRSMVL